MLIGILIVAALLLFYINTVKTLTFCFVVLGVLAGILVVNIALCWLIKYWRYRPSKEVKEQIDAAREKDAVAAAHNMEARAKAEKEHKIQVKEQVAAYQKELEMARIELAQHKRALENLDAVGPKEQKLDVLDSLIELMESRRAYSIPQALEKYDLECYKRHLETQMHIAKIRKETEMEMLKNQLDQQMAQITRKNNEIARQEKRIADELEQLREDEDYYRRYGQPRP